MVGEAERVAFGQHRGYAYHLVSTQLHLHVLDPPLLPKSFVWFESNVGQVGLCSPFEISVVVSIVLIAFLPILVQIPVDLVGFGVGHLEDAAPPG